MFSMDAPSFCACFTEEFIKTVQREPRSTGCSARQPQLRKFLDVIAQRIGKGLQKRAAARRTGLVQENIVDGAVADLEALDVLAADIDDKIHVGLKMRAPP